MTRRRRVFLFVLLFKSAADVAFGILFSGNGALIIKLFTAADAKLHLKARALEIDRKRHKRDALLLAKPQKAHNFALMKEKLALAERVAVKDVAVVIGLYASA